MSKLKAFLFYLWIGIWLTGSIIVFFLEIYVCVKFYPEFILFEIDKMALLLLAGLIIFGLIAVLCYLVLKLILSFKYDNDEIL